jgi:hypothetical protein
MDGSAVVECNGERCEVPAALADPSLRACCYEGRQCGLRVVGTAAVSDRCLPLMSRGEPNADCRSMRLPAAYVYGCCLDDRSCGLRFSSESIGAIDPGCLDPRVLGMPGGLACDPAHTCKYVGQQCGDETECCQLAPRTACASFAGEPATCAVPCALDEDCPTLCCRDTQGGGRACAPYATCTGMCDGSDPRCPGADADGGI